MTELAAISLGAATSLVLLIAAHFASWDSRPRLPLVARYTIGVACLNVGVTVTGALLQAWLLPVTVWTIAGCGGAVVAGLHFWRQEREAARTINLFHRAFTGKGVGDGAWETGEPNDRST